MNEQKIEENHVISVLTTRGHSRASVISPSSLSKDQECKSRNLFRSSRYRVPLEPKYFTRETELVRAGGNEW